MSDTKKQEWWTESKRTILHVRISGVTVPITRLFLHTCLSLLVELTTHTSDEIFHAANYEQLPPASALYCFGNSVIVRET